MPTLDTSHFERSPLSANARHVPLREVAVNLTTLDTSNFEMSPCIDTLKRSRPQGRGTKTVTHTRHTGVRLTATRGTPSPTHTNDTLRTLCSSRWSPPQGSNRVDSRALTTTIHLHHRSPQGIRLIRRSRVESNGDVPRTTTKLPQPGIGCISKRN